MGLPNRNVVKFSHTNRTHFTVGDPMAFPIVKMANKNPKTSPSLCMMWTLHLIQQCLGPSHAPPQTAAPTVEALLHIYAIKSPLVTMACPFPLPKVPIPMDQSPNPTTCLIPGPVRPMTPNGMWIQSTVFPQCTAQTDASTDHQRLSLITIGRCASNESDAA